MDTVSPAVGRLLVTLPLTRGDLLEMTLADAAVEVDLRRQLDDAHEALASVLSERAVWMAYARYASDLARTHERTIARLREQIRELMGRPRLHDEDEGEASA